MADPVSACLSGPAGQAGIGLILHLGAGACRELEAYLASDAARIVLVEPDPAVARALETRIGDDPRVELSEVALAPEDGTAPLKRVNLRGLSNLRAPEGLRELFPGLRLFDPVTVTTVSPETLRAALPAPSEEATAIDGLAAAGALTRFRRIFLHAGTPPLHAGSASLAELCARLDAAGYRLEATDAGTDPDRPCLAFVLPQAMIPAAALDAALAEARSAADAAEARRAAEAGETMKTLAGRLDAETARAAELGAALAEATARQTADAKALERLRTDLSLTLRLQTLREADLNDLRARHARLLEETEKKDALLGKLTERLALAADLMQRLDLAPPPLAAAGALPPATAPQGDATASGGRRKKRKAKA